MDFGTISVTVHQRGMMQEVRTYSFDGDVFLVGRRELYGMGVDMQMGNRFSWSGTPFIISKLQDWDHYAVIVKETSLKWRAYFFVLDPLVNLACMFWRRVVISMAIWNLADLKEGEVPGFHNIARRWSVK